MSLNSSSSEQYMSVLERSLFGFVASLPCLLCLWVNIMMLWTLRSKAVFRETPRFGMLFHLLLADTLQMVLSEILLVLAYLRVILSFVLCMFLILLSFPLHELSPLILVFMSLERFVAICMPLRHSAIATARNTTWACLGVWAFTTTAALLRLGLALQMSTSARPSIQTQMRDVCKGIVLFLGPHSRLFSEVLVYFLFLAAFLSITGSYTAVMRAARSASTDQASARKARTTLLLHLVQLCLMMASTFQSVLTMALFSVVPRIALARLQTVLYILLVILPKCLSALVYGLRDPTIRATLFVHLQCKLHKQLY